MDGQQAWPRVNHGKPALLFFLRVSSWSFVDNSFLLMAGLKRC